MSATKVFPQSKQSEFTLISMCIRHKSNFEVAVSHGLETDDFYNDGTRQCFTALQRLHNRKAFIDLYTVADELSAMGSSIKMEQIKEIVDKKVEHSDNLIGYIGQLQEFKNQRKLIEVIKTSEEIALSDKTADEKIELMSNEIAKVSSNRIDERNFIEKSSYSKVTDMIAHNIASKGQNTIKFGFPCIDENVILLPGVHIISAPPGGYKSALLQQIIDFNANNNKRGLFFSLEMNYEQLMMRKIQSATGISAWKMHSGIITPEELREVKNFEQKLSDNIIVNDTSNIDISRLKAVAKVENNKKKLDFIAIDYIQLIKVAGLKNKREDEEIKQISTELLGLAKDLGIPIIALAQMNRSFHTNEGKRPNMSNLHGGSQLEKDALSILFLYRQGQFDPTCPNPNRVEVIAGKNRWGNSNSSFLVADGERVRLREYNPEVDCEDPFNEEEEKPKKSSFKFK